MSDFLTNFQSGDYENKNKEKTRGSNEAELVETNEQNVKVLEEGPKKEDSPILPKENRSTK